jgi:uncharacterized cupin superfamily protein
MTVIWQIPPAIIAGAAIHPSVLTGRVAGRLKRALAEVFGLKNFAVNLAPFDPCHGPPAPPL